MATIYDPNSIPQGIPSIMMDVGGTPTPTAFVINDPGSSDDEKTSRNIFDTDNNGDYQPESLLVRDGGEPVTRTIVVQRRITSTPPPNKGGVATWDHDRSGTASTWVVTNVMTGTSKEERDTFTVELILVTYQG